MCDETAPIGPMEDEKDNHMPRVKMDFVGEYAGDLRARLQAEGYAVPVEQDPEQVCRLYLNFLRRRVPPVPRKVFVASEFSCPQDLQAGLDVVRGKIESGQDLSAHLSSRLKTLEYHDMLLNDWDIHHLHLGPVLKQDGYVERTKFVLFVRFLLASAYLIAVLPHGRGVHAPDPWGRQELLRIIHRNWPESIAAFRCNGVRLVEPPTDEQIHQARHIKIEGEKREAALTYFVEVDDVVYAPIGGGSASSQMSCDVVTECDRIFDALQEYEDLVRQSVPGIIVEAKARGLTVGDELSFNLRPWSGDTVVAVEQSTKMVFPVALRIDRATF
jgi:hypothetical protein